MLGRAEECEWLRQRLRIDHDGPPRTALLEGPLGSGKTALLHSALAHSDTPVTRLRGDRFLDTESPLAAARPLIELVFDSDLEDVVAEHSFASLQRHCRRFLTRSPRVLVIDDAQWLDARSLRLFTAVLPDAAGMVLAYRPGLVPEPLIDSARSAGAVVHHLRLGPLSDDAVVELARDLRPIQQRIVVESAAGNPLFAQVLINACERAPRVTSLGELLDTGSDDTSDALASVVGADVRGLDDRPRRTLTAIAVLGTTHPEHLARLTGSGTDALRADLRLLHRRGLLSTRNSEPLHPLVRHTAYFLADPGERATMHRRAAGLQDLDAFTRGEHLSCLRLDATRHEANALLDAAEHALDTDPHAADRWLTTVEHLGGPRRDLLWARAQVLLGRPDSAAATLAPLIDHPLFGTEARVLYAQTLRMAGLPAEAREILTARQPGRRPELLFELVATTVLFDRPGPLEDALRELAAGPDPYASAARAFRSIRFLNAGDVQEARTHFIGVADTLLHTPGEDLRDVLEAVSAAAWCAYMLDDFATAIDLAQRGLRIARRFGRANPQPGLGCALAYALVQAGRPADADVAATDAVDAAERFHVPDSIAMAHNALVLSAFWQHDTQLMRDRVHALQQAPLPAVPWWRRTVESTLARTCAMLGEPRPHHLEREPADVMTPLRYADSATIAMFTGRPDEARTLLHQGRDLAQRYAMDSQYAFLGMLLAGLIADTRPDEATALWQHAVATYQRVGMPGHLQLATEQLAAFRERTRTSPLAALTTREREIAHYLTTGATNQEIADELFLSRRTVEEHVSNILRKLDVSSRHRVAALIR